MQEMLLEDGEDHEDGKGRQRQFRWKNAGRFLRIYALDKREFEVSLNQGGSITAELLQALHTERTGDVF